MEKVNSKNLLNKSEYFKIIKIPPSLSENQKESEKENLQYGITA